MKKFAALILTFLMALSLVACAGNTKPAETSSPDAESSVSEETSVPKSSTTESESESEVTQEEVEGGNILIAYFTYGENAELSDDVDASATASIQIFNDEVTGNTGVMAHMIAEASGGELFSIRTVEPYPSYEDTIDVGQSEKNNGIHPELSTHIENLDQYDTIFVGFPKLYPLFRGCMRCIV